MEDKDKEMQRLAKTVTALANKHDITCKEAFGLTNTMFNEAKLALAEVIKSDTETWDGLSIEDKEMLCEQLAKALLDDYGVTKYLSNK